MAFHRHLQEQNLPQSETRFLQRGQSLLVPLHERRLGPLWPPLDLKETVYSPLSMRSKEAHTYQVHPLLTVQAVLPMGAGQGAWLSLPAHQLHHSSEERGFALPETH